MKSAWTVLLCAAVLSMAGCGFAGDAAGSSATGVPSVSPSDSEVSGTLTVFAAASLTDVYTQFAEQLEQQNPSLDVVLVFGGSSALAQQLLAGAPADVFAAADETTMATAVEGGVAADPVPFARNLLALTVPAANPGAVHGLDDLARPELIVALCASEVPCGRAADQLLLEQAVTPSVDTREQDVRSVLTKIELGEVDAGLVYATDARAAGDSVETVPITGTESVATTASVATVTGVGAAGNDSAAAAFIALVTSAEGARILRDAGFAVVDG